jgi:hypothetical protein
MKGVRGTGVTGYGGIGIEGQVLLFSYTVTPLPLATPSNHDY